MKILISGTPGVGKTTLSKKIKEQFYLKHIELSEFIIKNDLYTNYNKGLDTLEFKANKVRKYLQDYLKNDDNFIIDTHTVDIVKKINFDLIFVLRISSDILYKRLLERKYNQSKITENIEAEIFGIVEERVYEYFNDESVYIVILDELCEEDLCNKVSSIINTYINK